MARERTSAIWSTARKPEVAVDRCITSRVYGIASSSVALETSTNAPFSAEEITSGKSSDSAMATSTNAIIE